MDSGQEIAFINERGNLTLPASIRNMLGIKGKQQMLIEAKETGEIVLRPAVTVPIEYYTEARIAEFAEGEEELGRILDRLEQREFARNPHKPKR